MNLQSHAVSRCRAMSLMTVLLTLVGLLVLIVAALGVFVYVTRSDKAKLERKVAEVEAQRLKTELVQKQAAEEARLVSARNRQNELLTSARQATNALERLLAATRQATADAAALRTSDAGRSVALHPDLVAQARRLYDTELRELPLAEDLVTRLEAVRRIQLQVAGQLGTPYEPGNDLVGTVQSAGIWAEQTQPKVARVQNLVAALAQEARVKVTTNTVTAATPTLEGAIAQLNQAEAVMRQRIIQEQAEPARKEAAAVEAKAEVERIMAEAKARTDKLEADLRRLQQEKDEMRAALDRELALRRATNVVEDTKAAVLATNVLTEAQKLVLRQRAQSAEVQGKLDAFLTPGYALPNGKFGIDKQPHSLSLLRSAGALSPTANGLVKLTLIASDTVDKVRPRWRKYRGGATEVLKQPKELERAREAQQLLIDLGPTLVELGLLLP